MIIGVQKRKMIFQNVGQKVNAALPNYLFQETCDLDCCILHFICKILIVTVNSFLSKLDPVSQYLVFIVW